MANLAEKYVLSELIDTWSRGPGFLSRFQMMGPVMKSGDSVDIGYPAAAATVNNSESASVESLSQTTLALTVSTPYVINQAVGNLDDHILFGSGGQYLRQMTRARTGDLVNDIERDAIEYLIRSIAGASVNNHFNLAADAITDDDVAAAEAYMLQQDGTTHDDLLWLVSPQAVASLRSVADYIPSDPGSRDDLGRRLPASLNGIPLLIHNGVPGGANRLSSATSAASITSNVGTYTIAASQGWVAGQLIHTTGLTVSIAVASPVAVTSYSGTSLVAPTTGADGAMADGVGEIRSASGYAMLVNTKRVFWAMVGAMPQYHLVKREANFGHSLQLGTFFNIVALPSSCAIVHTPDGV